jgi:Fe2+ transport system protein FeoA
MFFNMNLSEGKKGQTYTIKSINGNEELNSFLFSLGCIEGEVIKIIKKMRKGLIVNIRGGRFGLDSQLASVIEIVE